MDDGHHDKMFRTRLSSSSPPLFFQQPAVQHWQVHVTSESGLSPSTNPESSIFLVDHAWTYRVDQHGTARAQLRDIPGLLERMADLMDITFEGDKDVNDRDSMIEKVDNLSSMYQSMADRTLARGGRGRCNPHLHIAVLLKEARQSAEMRNRLRRTDRGSQRKKESMSCCRRCCQEDGAVLPKGRPRYGSVVQRVYDRMSVSARWRIPGSLSGTRSSMAQWR